MKITYTAPNRPYHYPYAEALHRAGHLHAFVSGFSRFSSRSPLESVGKKLKRHDFFQNFYIASLKFKAPFPVMALCNRLSNLRMDQVSYPWAKESDVFIFHRTQGLNTTRRLHREGMPTLCVMEEVNSHVEVAHNLMRNEYEHLGLGKYFRNEPDYDLRLKTYDAADCILCPSDFVRRSFIAKGFAPNRIIKVNFGFPPVSVPLTQAAQSHNGTFRLLFVGQVNYRKGLRYAIEAFRKLKHPKKEFMIVGPQTEITGLEKTQIPEGVVFTGALKGEALTEQYRRANVFVLPSIEEGLALVQGEALAFGVPLLITTNTGGDDLIKDGVEGFIVAAGDEKAMAEKLQQMADDKNLLAGMSAAALQKARTLGSWDITADRLITSLTTILSNRKQ